MFLENPDFVFHDVWYLVMRSINMLLYISLGGTAEPRSAQSDEPLILKLGF